MRTLFSLLTDTVRATAPIHPDLQFAPSAAILATALKDAITSNQQEQLAAALNSCIAGHPRALEDLADTTASIRVYPEIAAHIDRVAVGLADLLALRTALKTPHAAIRLQLDQPELFEVLHYFELPPTPEKPYVVFIGRIRPNVSLTFRIPPRHPILSFVSIAYDAIAPGPLLSISIGSGNQQSWESDRTNWRQTANPADDLRLRRREIHGSITTCRLTDSFTISRPSLEIELRPLPQMDMYLTTMSDERKQPLCYFFQMYPSI